MIYALKKLSFFHSVRLLWVPGHSNIPGNETADMLAEAAAILTFEGPEPVLGVSTTGIRTNVRCWTHKEVQKSWQANSGCQQAKLFIDGPDKQLTGFALGLSKQDLRVLVGLITDTGHTLLNRHLTMMKVQSDPICSACEDEEETTQRFLGSVWAYAVLRHRLLGAHRLRPEELSKVQPTNLLRFARASKRYSNQ